MPSTPPDGQTSQTVAGAVEAFNRELRLVYNRAARPSIEDMARRSGRPVGVFAFLRSPSVLPSWDQVTALLTGTGSHSDPSVVARLRQRWARLAGQLARQRASRPEADTAPDRSAGPGHAVGSLNAVMAAGTAREFADALEQRRLYAGLSYQALAKATSGVVSKSTAQRMTTQGRLPARREALAAFLKACHATDHEIQIWWEAVERIRYGQPPTIRPSNPGLLGATIDVTQYFAEQTECDLCGGVVSTAANPRVALPRSRPFSPTQFLSDSMEPDHPELVYLRAELVRLREDNIKQKATIEFLIRAFRKVDSQLQHDQHGQTTPDPPDGGPPDGRTPGEVPPVADLVDHDVLDRDLTGQPTSLDRRRARSRSGPDRPSSMVTAAQ
jgi:hypothetical protein